MKGDFQLQIDDVVRLYGSTIYRLGNETPIITPTSGLVEAENPTLPTPQQEPEKPQPEKVAATPGIVWRLKETSKMLFVLHQDEFKDKALTELLKKIVESLKIPFEAAGFGMITGTVNPSEFDTMPKDIAVVFDRDLLGPSSNPRTVAVGEVYFTHKLALLANDQAYKRELWNYLKQVQSKLS